MTKSISLGPEICDVAAAAWLVVELLVNDDDEAFLALISAGITVK